jgi:hypothetical protein
MSGTAGGEGWSVFMTVCSVALLIAGPVVIVGLCGMVVASVWQFDIAWRWSASAAGVAGIVGLVALTLGLLEYSTLHSKKRT